MNIIDVADEIHAMHRELEFLRSEVERLAEYEQKYHQLLDESVKHGQQQMVGWLGLLMSDKVRIEP